MSDPSFKQDYKAVLDAPQGQLTYYSLDPLINSGLCTVDSLPFSIKILLENVIRNVDDSLVTANDVKTILGWNSKSLPTTEFPFMPSRVLMQDFTGVPAVVDLAAMRSTIARTGGDPTKINPIVPVDLVIDHSVQVDFFGTNQSFQKNVEREFERNKERYMLLRWAQNAFENFRVVPPGTGIVHQVNLEYLASVVDIREIDGTRFAFPDTVVGTDSHTTMINGLSVLGWGVGGIEAEAVLLRQPYYMQLPEVIGVKLIGRLNDGVTATDLVLTITQILREKGVVGKFVEFFGSGLKNLPLPDRATIANMAPEYGATCGFFPTDEATLDYLYITGRDRQHIDLVEQYTKAQGLFRTDQTSDPEYTDIIEIDLDNVEASLAGPKRPNDRINLSVLSENFHSSFNDEISSISDDHASQEKSTSTLLNLNGQDINIDHGSVVIAAITSCTNTSNPSVMIGAGLLAQKAVSKGLTTEPWVKTSMAPGSQVVTDYLKSAGVAPYLDLLGFNNVGYGCTTCIGNSGPLPKPISEAITANNLIVASVLSGNRNFEGRIHSQVTANYLASPMLVVAYALAGTVDIDLSSDPLGNDDDGHPVYLKDVWPSQKEIGDAINKSLNPSMFQSRYKKVFEGTDAWQCLPVPSGDLYKWDPDSTYIKEAPFFKNIEADVSAPQDILDARVLVMLKDSITTDHISPAGSIPPSRAAGQYLVSKGVTPAEFNTFGARRGNHEVMLRGTFGNIRLRNQLIPDKEGDWTKLLPDNKDTSIFDAAITYQDRKIPTIVIAGKEYGSGSSRDWAAKGPSLLGVKATIAESYERIHRSNLVGMGILPLQFQEGENAQTLGLNGRETYNITGITEGLTPLKTVNVMARRKDGEILEFMATVRIDTSVEVNYYNQGGVLHTVLRRMLSDT